MAEKNSGARWGALKTVWRYIRRYRVLILSTILLAACCVIFTLYVPVLVGGAIDLIVGPGQVDFAGIGAILAKIGVCIGLAACCQWGMEAVNTRITSRVVRDIRCDAFRKLQVLPLGYIDSHPHGDILSRLIADVDQFSDGLLLGFSQFFTGVLSIICTLIFMLRLNLGITLLVVLLTPLSLLVASFIARRTYAMFRQQSEVRAEQTAFLDEMIGGQKTVQAFSYEKKSMERFDEMNERLEKVSTQATFFSSITNPGTRFINGLVYAAVALAGALSALSGAITVGGISAFLSYANQYTKPFNEISGVITELQNALACAGRIFSLIEEEPQTPDRPGARVLGVGGEAVKGQVELEHVAFSYSPGQRLIQNFNLQVEPGRRVAVVGPTGCGKTTLINLLMRFYDVNEGSIRVEGSDVRDITRNSLRASFGMVLQDTWLRDGTVRENIAMAKPDATDEEVTAAAKAAHAHAFIMALPQGYGTVIKGDGGSLSQGQRQMLCITRVMLRLPPMLILDEATSSIDTRTEVLTQKAFARMMQGRTSFVVAHRLSTIREADIILVMREGNVVEQGNHGELLAKNGFYAELYNSQFAL